jgi:imidazolonepropionase-like amidohydrolase
MKHTLSLLSLLFVCTLTFAQNPAAGKPQTKPIALVGGTIHIGNGQIIQNGTIVFDKGIITSVGDATTNFDKNSTEIINITGKSVYPGIIAPNNQMGLQEIGAVRATADNSEIGAINPNVRALVAFNTDAETIPTVRGNGVLITQATPEGGIVSGTSSVMELDGWNWEDAALRKDDGVWLNFPSFFSRQFDLETFRFNTKKSEKHQEEITALQKFFSEASAYSEMKNISTQNARFEAMKGLFDGSKTLYVRADYGKEIIEAVKFAQQFTVKKIVIVGGDQADLAIDFLKENNIPIIVTGTQRLPQSVDEDVWQPYKLPSKLMKAGLLVGMFYEAEFWRTRNLPFNAGMAASFGMSKEEALQMITLNNAKILGIDKQVGTLEIGKMATIAVSAGDILDMRTSKVEMEFIRGKKVDLDDKQKRLYLKYKEKYGIK